MALWKQFKSKACSVDLAARTKEAALEEVVANLAAAQLLTKAQATKALAAFLERESVASTGVGMGVAIPHIKLAGIETSIASLSVSRAGLEWKAIDAAPVQVIFTVLRPDQPSGKHDPARHLELMQWISRLSRHADFRSFAAQASTKAQLLELLAEMESA